MRELPVSQTDFETIRQYGNYYADKTDLLYTLVQEPNKYFLSRPRRFGKTLLVSTLESILRGRRDLFKDLWIDGSDYDWTAYPVIRLTMNEVCESQLEVMKSSLMSYLKGLADDEDLVLDGESPAILFRELIRLLRKKYIQKVAILIDEYDAPILHHIKDSAKADAVREELKIFYGILKGRPGSIGHVFITGVTRFTKTSLFSEVNDLIDLTLKEGYGTICGLTMSDLDDLLSEYQERTLASLIKRGTLPKDATGRDLKQLILDWYDGYSWDGETRILNPWSLLNFFNDASVKNFWFKSGTPTFLFKLYKDRTDLFDHIQTPPVFNDSDNFIDDLDTLDPTALLFQTGYLTLKKQLPNPWGEEEYRVVLPNLEVKASLLPLTLSLKRLRRPHLAKQLAEKARDCLLDMDKEGFEESFGDYLAQYTYDNREETETQIVALFQSAMIIADQAYHTQTQTSHGRTDIDLRGKNSDVFIIEIKLYREKIKSYDPYVPPDTPKEAAGLRQRMAPLAKKAMSQINKKYVQSFKGEGRIIKVALVVARRTFVLAEFEAHGV
jgi:hypothetical protein